MSLVRRALGAGCALTLLGALGSTPSLGGPLDGVLDTNAAPGGFMSDNVTWLGNLPIDATGGIGARVVEVAPDDVRLYVTSAGGLSIYDVTAPELPLLLGHLVLPHFENEDVEVSRDGTRTIISADYFVGGGHLFGTLYVIDTSDPTLPVVAAEEPHGSHTVTCVDDACEWLYSSESEIYHVVDTGPDEGTIDLSVSVDGTTTVEVLEGDDGWEAQVEGQIGRRLRQGAHDHYRDASGLLVTDTLPRLVLDVSDPAHPEVVGHSRLSGGEDAAGETAYQHNNQRPAADAWAGRQVGDRWTTGDPLRPGELLLANGETNFTNVPFLGAPLWVSDPARNAQPCGESNGPFATWNMADFDADRDMTPIEVFRPVTSNLEDLTEAEQAANRPWLDGNPALNALGCSGHWFDHLPAADHDDDPGTGRRILTAAGWYEHGTRFLAVDESTGDIDEVGFFQPVDGSTFAVHWITDEIAYTIDLTRGIDVLRFDHDAPEPTIQELHAAWTAPVSSTAVDVSRADRLFCSIAATSRR